MSKYFDRFQRLLSPEFSSAAPRLRGATLLVEVLPKEEIKTSGGIILGQSNDTHKGTADDHRRNLGLVIAVGEGYAGGEPCELKVGQLILMPYQPLYLSEFPGLKDYTANTLALVNEGDVLVVYESSAAYAKAKEVLNYGA